MTFAEAEQWRWWGGNPSPASPLVTFWNIFRKVQDLVRLRFGVGIVHLIQAFEQRLWALQYTLGTSYKSKSIFGMIHLQIFMAYLSTHDNLPHYNFHLVTALSACWVVLRTGPTCCSVPRRSCPAGGSQLDPVPDVTVHLWMTPVMCPLSDLMTQKGVVHPDANLQPTFMMQLVVLVYQMDLPLLVCHMTRYQSSPTCLVFQQGLLGVGVGHSSAVEV